MASGQTPRHELSTKRVYYGDGDEVTVEIADFDGTDISTWDFEVDLYDDGDLVGTLSTANGDFNVKGTDSDILELTLSSTQTDDTFGTKENNNKRNDPVRYEGVVKAKNAGLDVNPWRFLILQLQAEVYEYEVE